MTWLDYVLLGVSVVMLVVLAAAFIVAAVQILLSLFSEGAKR